MAMSALKVGTAQLRAKANEFEGEAKKLKTTTDRMMSLITEINGKVWSGDAAKAYKNQFKQLQDDNERMYKRVNEFSTDLKEIAKEYDRVENENQNIARSLATDVIK